MEPTSFAGRATKAFLRIVAQRMGGLSEALYRAANAYVLVYKNVDYYMPRNGETRMLAALPRESIKTVFDVGANHGEWSAVVAARFPEATIHAFEIVPSTYETLARTLASSPGVRVKANPVGLSDRPGTVSIRYAPANDTLSSLVAGEEIHDTPWTSVEAQVTTGDEYCRNSGIERIDFLKIDVEGAEHLVARGFEGMFERERIGLVQFEYGLANIYSKFLLADWWKFFADRGFSVGKLMPRHVAFKPYSPRDEDFLGPNFVAVHRSRTDLTSSLC